jgi:Tfp pilus assembly protein PilO
MARTQGERLWLIIGGLVAAVLTLIGYFAFISPQQDETSEVQGQVQSVEDRNSGLEATIATLRRENQDLATYEKQAAQARLELPDTADLSAFLRTLQSIGGSTRTDVVTLTAGNPVDVTSATAAASTSGSTSLPTTLPTTEAGTDQTTSATDPTASVGTDTTSLTSTASTASGPRVYALPISATVVGATTALDDFLTQLQSVQPRAVLISQLAESTVEGSRKAAGVTSLALTMYAFVAPGTAAQSEALQSATGR